MSSRLSRISLASSCITTMLLLSDFGSRLCVYSYTTTTPTTFVSQRLNKNNNNNRGLSTLRVLKDPVDEDLTDVDYALQMEDYSHLRHDPTAFDHQGDDDISSLSLIKDNTLREPTYQDFFLHPMSPQQQHIEHEPSRYTKSSPLIKNNGYYNNNNNNNNNEHLFDLDTRNDQELSSETDENNDNQQQQQQQQQQEQQQGLQFPQNLPQIPQAAFHWAHKTFNNNNNNNNQNDAENNNNNENNKNLGHWLVQQWQQRFPSLVSSTSEWKRLAKHAEYIQSSTHLRDLMQDPKRCDELYAIHDGVYLDYSRQRVTLETMKFLFDLAKKQKLGEKIKAMVSGEKINFTEDRAVLHTALRADRSKIGSIIVDDVDVVKEIHEVLDKVKAFTNGVRSGAIRGYTGKRLRNIVSVGIGGSYLGPEFLHECLKTEPEGINAALGYNLRFLSNVDPVDVERTCADLDPEETLIVVVSKTFTTAETMLNARTMRQWLWDFMGNDLDVVKHHMVACASESAMDKVSEFGIDTDKCFFKFWDFIGGRYSVCSAAGAVPISLLYGFDLFEKFLQGARSIDDHFVSAPFHKNIPVLMGLLGVWNMSFLKYTSRTTLPYAEALLKLPAHIQQLDMESNGKHMTKQGLPVDYPVGEIDFGEAGTNGQHSFYQLLHMGQIIPCDFIGFLQSQHDLCLDGEFVSSHDELMANFFAQPDALANGKTVEEVRAEGVREDLIAHRTFTGNRPSLLLLLPKLTAYACGQILAIYEHRTAVQGFIWDINSFDQWGVELGKKLALDIKKHVIEARSNGSLETQDAGNPATTRLLNYYLQNSRNTCSLGDEGDGSNPVTRVTRKTHRDSSPPPHSNDLRGQQGRLQR